jgi:hypothetical protein
MTKRMTKAKSDPAKLVLLAAIAIVGLLVTRRYGIVPVLRAINQALRVARVVRSSRSVARPTGRRPARRVRRKVLGFANSGS